MKVHEKIRFLRESKKLSQEEMASKLNMSVSGYSKIERGVGFNDVIELISLGERYILIDDKGHNNIYNDNSVISELQLISENEKLKLMLAHKDELISFKDELINQLKQENSYLKSVLHSQDKSQK